MIHKIDKMGEICTTDYESINVFFKYGLTALKPLISNPSQSQRSEVKACLRAVSLKVRWALTQRVSSSL